MISSKRQLRITLGAAAVLLICIDAWWLITQHNRETQQFSISLLPTAVEYSEESDFPQYDPATGRWAFQGHDLKELRPYLRDSDGGPHRVGKFLVVNVTEPTTVDDVRKTYHALIENGICQVAVTDKAYRPGGTRTVLAVHIDWAVDERGDRIPCKSKFG
ncbi:MAG TPA: hypothetical protein PLM58_05975 [Novosphingobium sp.]|nr:hypothetical protein [Novosphingobium sp.]